MKRERTAQATERLLSPEELAWQKKELLAKLDKERREAAHGALLGGAGFKRDDKSADSSSKVRYEQDSHGNTVAVAAEDSSDEDEDMEDEDMEDAASDGEEEEESGTDEEEEEEESDDEEDDSKAKQAS